MIAIMSAMHEEMNTLLLELKNSRSYAKGFRKYHIGNLFGKEVVLVFSRWGKVAAATTTAQLINDFNLELLIFTGVAGSVKPEFQIGDIIIGNHLYQHDVNASPLFNRFELPLLEKSSFKTDETCSLKLLDASRLFIENIHKTISQEEATNFSIMNPKVIHGDIASGDQFINSISQVNFINSNLQSVVCVEMEGAAVAQVCYEYQIPFSIIRIISDNANDNAHVDFKQFANQIASKYALKILEYYFA